VLAASLYVTCGALRLARFNVQFDNVEKRHFIGLPIPAAAEVVATTVMLYYFFGGEGATYRHLIVLLMVYALAALMVSNVRYFSFKEIHIHRRQPFWVLVLVILTLKLFIAEPQICLFATFIAYAASGPLRSVWVNGRRLVRRAIAARRLTSSDALLASDRHDVRLAAIRAPASASATTITLAWCACDSLTDDLRRHGLGNRLWSRRR
jgi:hypothetical protein